MFPLLSSYRPEAALVSRGLAGAFDFNTGLGGVIVPDMLGVRNGTLGATTTAPVWANDGLVFDATDDIVSFNTAIQIADKLQHTLILVAKSPAGGSNIYGEGNTGTTEFIYLQRDTGNNRLAVRYRRTTATSYDVSFECSPNTWPVSTYKLIVVRRDGVNADMSCGLTATASTASLGSTALPTRNNCYLNVAAASAFASPAGPTMAFMAFYHTNLSDSEILANYETIRTMLRPRGVLI